MKLLPCSLLTSSCKSMKASHCSPVLLLVFSRNIYEIYINIKYLIIIDFPLDHHEKMIINNCLELLFLYPVPVFVMCVFVHGSEVMQCFICIQHFHLNSHIYSLPEVSVFYVPCLQFTVSFQGHFNAI